MMSWHLAMPITEQSDRAQYWQGVAVGRRTGTSGGHHNVAGRTVGEIANRNLGFDGEDAAEHIAHAQRSPVGVEQDGPLARIQGAYNEVGCVAPNSIAKLDNSITWLGQDARGRGIVYRANTCWHANIHAAHHQPCALH